MINALNLVKKNGYLIISVPAYSHLYSKFDEEVGHYRRYEKKDIKTILKDVNFAKLYLKYYDSVGYFLSLMSKLISSDYQKNLEKKIRIWN